MARKLLIAVFALACLAFALKPAFGDGGRDGGIVVLPAAASAFNTSRATLATYTFGAGVDIRLQLPPELRKAITITEVDGVVVSSGSVSGCLLLVPASDIARMQSAGVDAFVIRVISPDLHSLVLSFDIRADGSVRLTIS